MRLPAGTENPHGSLHERVAARGEEIEQAALARIKIIADPAEVADPLYREGLRAAVAAAVAWGLEALGAGEERVDPVPVALLSQARLAARNGICLDTVLRRYFAGYRLLTDVLLSEAAAASVSGDALKRPLGAIALRFDRLLVAVAEEFRLESKHRAEGTLQRRAELVLGLLSGELIDHGFVGRELAYDLEAHHLGLLAAGPGAADALRKLAAGLDCRLLLLSKPEHVAWAWLGARRHIDPAAVESLATLTSDPSLALALGEPAEELSGWRLTHRQAAAALPVALREPRRPVRYANVALLAAALRDDLLVTSLHDLYLAPLRADGAIGKTRIRTLRTYLNASRNVSSTAAALGVKRHTVTNRLREIEARLGRDLDDCAMEVELALKVEQMNTSTDEG